MSVYDSNLFANYLNKSDEKKALVKRLKERMQGDNLKILDLGCHDGALTAWYLDEIEAKDIDLIAVDPSKPALEKFAERTWSKNVKTKLVNATAEEFLGQNTQHFDWIIASHCLYWSENLAIIIEQIAKKSDQAIVVLRGKRGIYQIQKKFKYLLGNSLEKLYTSDDIESVLGFKVEFEHENILSNIEIDFDNSDQLQSLLCFFLQRDVGSLSRDEMAQVKDFVGGLGQPIKHEVSFFWL